MGVFDKILKNNESVFADDVALDYDYVPKLMPYREKEQFKIASAIKPLFAERNGKNVFVVGKPGIGKTLAIKHILNELEEETDEIIPIYVNCWQKNTSYKVLLEICDILGYKFTQNKKTEELFTIIKDIVNKKSAVFVFDEVDKSEEIDVLYTLIEQVYRKTLIMITNYKSWLEGLDIRVQSRLTPELIEFNPYNAEETKGILKNRMKYAFQPDVWDEDAFELVINKSTDLADVRSGLYIMREAGNAAEDRVSKKIEIQDVKVAIKKLDDFKIKKETDLDEETLKIYNIIKTNPDQRIGELFKVYEESGGEMTYKTFQRKVEKLDKGQYIDKEKISGGKEGKTTIIHLNTNKTIDDLNK